MHVSVSMNWYRLADALSLIHKHASANIDESVWMDGRMEGVPRN